MDGLTLLPIEPRNMSAWQVQITMLPIRRPSPDERDGKPVSRRGLDVLHEKGRELKARNTATILGCLRSRQKSISEIAYHTKLHRDTVRKLLGELRKNKRVAKVSAHAWRLSCQTKLKD